MTRSIELNRAEAEFIVDACSKNGAPQWAALESELRQRWGMTPSLEITVRGSEKAVSDFKSDLERYKGGEFRTVVSASGGSGGTPTWIVTVKTSNGITRCFGPFTDPDQIGDFVERVSNKGRTVRVTDLEDPEEMK
jgi:hypothetical protein